MIINQNNQFRNKAFKIFLRFIQLIDQIQQNNQLNQKQILKTTEEYNISSFDFSQILTANKKQCLIDAHSWDFYLHTKTHTVFLINILKIYIFMQRNESQNQFYQKIELILSQPVTKLKIIYFTER
ncbi:hypothetical protein ABPG74_021654 [Tetrahymena malaccensis]